MTSLNRFKEHLLNKGFSKVTITGYERVLKKFLREKGKPTKQKAKKYITTLKREDYSYSHISNTTTILTRYMEFLGKSIEIEKPRRPKHLPSKEILTVGETARLLAACKNSREKAMIAILAYCGLRNKEVCNLKVKHIDLGGNLIKVIRGKFKKDRVVPIHQDCAAIITQYLNEYSRDRDEYLFTTLKGNRQYNGWALRDRVKTVAKRTDIEKNIHPHLFRHSFITHLIDGGASVVAVKNFAGHVRLETTLSYTHLSSKSMQRQYLFYMPSYI